MLLYLMEFERLYYGIGEFKSLLLIMCVTGFLTQA
jgi:hypothetical protein